MAPLPSPACTDDGLGLSGGRVRRARFYDAMNGFAAHARTSGGLGRRYFEVNSPDDSISAPPGSLRAALAGAAAAGGGWIGFAPALRGKRIVLKAPLRLVSNLTIDGGCQAPIIEGARIGSLFYLRSIRNVVISRLSMQHASPTAGETGKGDCITVSHGSDRIWIAFNNLRSCADGLVDVTQDGSDRHTQMTVAYNRFLDHDKAMIVAGEPKSSAPALALQVTLFRNVFLRTAQRHPRVSGSAFVHVVENVVAFRPYRRPDGTWSGAFGSLAIDGGKLRVERTLYVPLSEARTFRSLIGHDPKSAPAPPYSIEAELDLCDPLKAAAEIAATAGSSGWRRLSTG